jgi:hypothetical protein
MFLAFVKNSNPKDEFQRQISDEKYLTEVKSFGCKIYQMVGRPFIEKITEDNTIKMFSNDFIENLEQNNPLAVTEIRAASVHNDELHFLCDDMTIYVLNDEGKTIDKIKC